MDKSIQAVTGNSQNKTEKSPEANRNQIRQMARGIDPHAPIHRYSKY